MKRFLVAIVGVSLLLSGCSSSASTGGAHPSPSADQGRYLSTVRQLYPSTVTKEDLLNLGHSLCTLLSKGGSYSDALSTVQSSKRIRSTAAAQVKDSVKYLCPKHLSDLPG